ncbi:MAG: metallophosphoesterase [Desulfopila sp.]
MKILSVSDKVCSEILEKPAIAAQCRDVDLIISCGDLPPEFLTLLRNRFDAQLYYVLGNHDIRYDTSPPVGCSCIDRRIVSVGGYSLIGFSGSRWYNGGLNQYREREMSRRIRRLRFSLWRNGAPDIVVTHAPPRHIHDAEDRCHKGFKCYDRFIRKYRPSYFLHGHIHRLFKADGERITVVDNTQVINSYGFYIFQI